MLKNFYRLFKLAFAQWADNLFISSKTQYLAPKDKAIESSNSSPNKQSIKMQCKGSIDISMHCSLTGPSIGMEKAIRVIQREK